MTWPVVALGDVAASEPRAITDGPFGSNLASRHYTEVGPRVVRLQNIGDGRFVDARAHVSQEHFESLRAHEVQGGDLLVASLGEVLPRACLAPDWLGPAIVKADCIRVRLSDAVDPRWVLYALQRPAVRRWADEHRHGVGRPRLGLKTIRAIPIPLPPLVEQRRIVDLLEDHLSRLDAAVRSLEENRKRSAALRQAAIDRAFWMGADPSAEKFLHELISQRGWPAGTQGKAAASPDVELLPDELPWPVASLEQLTDPIRTIRYGILKPKVHGGTVPYVEVKDLRDPPLEGIGLRLTSADLDAQYAAARIRPGDVVVAVRGSFERSAVVPSTLRAANISRDVVRLAPLPGISPWFLHYWHQTSTTKRYLRRHARGVAVRGVNVGSLRAMPVPVLTPDSQRAVVRAISDQEEAINRLDHEVQVAQSRASLLRRSLLAAAFSGQLVGEPRE